MCKCCVCDRSDLPAKPYFTTDGWIIYQENLESCKRWVFCSEQCYQTFRLNYLLYEDRYYTH